MPNIPVHSLVFNISVPLLVILAYLYWKGIAPSVPREQWLQLFFFSLAGSVYSFAGYVCVEYLPLGSAATLGHAVYMLMVPLTSIAILKENMSKTQWTSIICAIGGSCLIFFGLIRTVEIYPYHQNSKVNLLQNATNISINRSYNYLNYTNQAEPNKSQTSSKQHHITSSSSDFAFGLILAILSGISGNLFTTMAKLLQDHLESPLILAVWYNVSGMIICTILMLMVELDTVSLPSDLRNWFFLAVHVLSNVITSVTNYVALYFASAIVCNIAFNLQIPFMIISQYIIFRHLQPIHGSFYDLIGACVITLAVTLPFTYDFITLLKAKKIVNTPSTDEEQSLIALNTLE